MLITVQCEACHRLLATTGPIHNHTLKCPRCRHLQYVPNPEEPLAPAGESYVPGRAVSDFAFARNRIEWDMVAERRGPATWIVSDDLTTRGWAGNATLADKPLPKVKVTRDAVLPTGPAPRSDLLYWLLALTLVPLAWSLSSAGDDSGERLLQAQREHPETFRQYQNGEVTLAEVVENLPGGRLEGACLPKQTWMHWGYAGLSSLGFLGFIAVLFPRASARVSSLVMIAVFTGTIGTILLMSLQLIALLSIWFPAGGVITPVLFIIKFFHQVALSPDSHFLLSFIGFICGIGLCEELIKALPIICYFANFNQLSWRGACRWGLASGAGLGIAEGILYSSAVYNGIQRWDVYIVRFVSCVALHAIWSACAALKVHRARRQFQAARSWFDYVLPVLWAIAVPILLHGTYDATLKMGWHLVGLATALASFGWLAWLIEAERGRAAHRFALPVGHCKKATSWLNKARGQLTLGWYFRVLSDEH